MLLISPINFNRQTYAKNNFNRNIINTKNDSFVLSQKSNLSFGAIPRKEIFACCDKVLKDIEKVTDCDKVREIADIFFLKRLVKLRKKLNPNLKLEYAYEHELVSAYLPNLGKLNEKDRGVLLEYYPDATTDIKYLNAQKKELKKAVDIIKSCTNRWSTLEKWNKPNKIIPFQDVFNLLKRMPPKSQYKNIQVEGLGLLKGKRIENPVRFYTYVSQPLGNAIKYGGNKSFKINIEEVERGGKNAYYASFLNLDTKIIPNAEIDKILEGCGYRAQNARQERIKGRGKGFFNIVRILKENGYGSDIPNLIEKGREKGVNVRIPLIGVC